MDSNRRAGRVEVQNVQNERTDRAVLPRHATRNGKACSCVGDETGTSSYRATLIRPTRRDRRYRVPRGTDNYKEGRTNEERIRFRNDRSRRSRFVFRDTFSPTVSRETHTFVRDECESRPQFAAPSGSMRSQGGVERRKGKGARNNSPRNICRVERIPDC